MPELPEVETVRRDLEPWVVGRRIVGLDVDAATAPLLLGGVPVDEFRARLTGRRITALRRRGKYLCFELDDGASLLAHLRMTGRLVRRARGAPPEPYERARIVLGTGEELRWCDLRKFGTWQLTERPDDITGRLGPEPLDPCFTADTLARSLAGRRAPVKSVLLNQRRIAGLGNIYADEALFAAGIHPARPAGSLSRGEVERLHAAIRSVLARGVEHRGASFRDYVDGEGAPGQEQMYVQVFRRTGKPCYRCGATISRIVLGGRSTHFCPRCQPAEPQREDDDRARTGP